MKALTYRNTRTPDRFTDKELHIKVPIGYAYETDSHFVHYYGLDSQFHQISIGACAIEGKAGTLEDWIKKTFGAVEIEELSMEVGLAIEAVWRPALYFYTDTYQALQTSETDMRLAEQSLRLLIDKLDELFLFIEPSESCMNAYSHKTRELLILACTEVENTWASYMSLANYTNPSGRFSTRDYVKLLDKLHLRDYQFKLKSYKELSAFRPFKDWNDLSPTVSLQWYDAYNKTKHDRTNNFSVATLRNCINAVVANLVMHCVRFSPIPMFEDHNMFSSMVQQHFRGELIGSCHASFYLPLIDIPSGTTAAFTSFDPNQYGWIKAYNVHPFTL